MYIIHESPTENNEDASVYCCIQNGSDDDVAISEGQKRAIEFWV